ncbi:MAG: SBBP repeat-containing protein [Ignavibacteria bacterium]|nr:SBBP repeat-containing protein [Ignavibacteria bacterium]
MKKIILFTAIMLMASASVSFSQVISRVFSYNGPGNQVDKCNGIAQDNQGRVYATGVSWGGSSTKEDFATIKFGDDGDYLWVARYDGPGHNLDYASAITIDNAGNVYVTGWSRSSSDYGSEDYCTIKYNTNGVVQWTARYNGAVNTDCYYYDYARAISVDAQGNVYVTGDSWGNDNLNGDYLTLKYNSSGVLQWAKRYNGASSKEDIASSLALDANGNVYVTGKSFQNSKGFDMLTVKYNNAGTQQWTARYDGPAFLDDAASEVKTDLSGNILITGSSHGGSTKLDYATIKYNSAGQQQWLKRYTNPGINDTDAATGLDIDVYGNAYVTGYSKGPQTGTSPVAYDYLTIKYNSSDGGQAWLNKYDGGSNDKAYDIKVIFKACVTDKTGGYVLEIPCWEVNIFVTGQSQVPGGSNDIVTLKYGEGGNTLWTSKFNGPANTNDAAYSISASSSYPVIYAGGSFSNDYGIIGITQSRAVQTDNIKGISMNYPNPFNPETNIYFNLQRESPVKIVLYDMLGRTVSTLLDKNMEPGLHSVNWNASNFNSGVYFYRIETSYASETKKLVLIK